MEIKNLKPLESTWYDPGSFKKLRETFEDIYNKLYAIEERIKNMEKLSNARN